MYSRLNFLLLLISLCSCTQPAGNNTNPSGKETAAETKFSSDSLRRNEYLHPAGFVFRTDSSYEDDAVVLTVWKNQNEVLQHTLYKNNGDCSSINLELGNYQSSENKIVFYSYWASSDRQHIALYPFGFRKQVYTIDDTGTLTRTESKIYLEDYVEKTPGKDAFYAEHETWKHKGLEFLVRGAQNKEEQAAMDDYIKCIETLYLATFVTGNEKALLENEVRTALKAEIALHTLDWDNKEIYGSTNK